ncbi:MAG: hypothetical protein IIZ39_10605, partial [Blautia sp.]|nr:hypothetical protein [Blautia sp.]
MAEVPEVSICLPGDISTREFYGDHPYRNVVCMIVYVCHNTGNFHLRFADKLKELDECYGSVEVFLPSCVPDIPHVVFMVQYLKKLNPKAEVLFDADEFSSFDWTMKARFSLFVITSEWPGWIYGKKGNMDPVSLLQEKEVACVAQPGLGELVKELARLEEKLHDEQEKVKALEKE